MFDKIKCPHYEYTLVVEIFYILKTLHIMTLILTFFSLFI
jgi:hypothetical protein